MKKIALLTMAVMLFFAAFTAGAVQASSTKKSTLSGKVTINGSSALLPLMLQATKEFKKKHPKVRISTSGSSSIVGPQSVRKGVATIGTCDWDASTDVPGFKKFDGQIGHKVAVIPFTTVVNKNVKVTNLTQAQIISIFQGKTTNWKEVGGDDAPIVVINRAFGSGTRVNYQAKALNGESFMTKGDNYKEVKSTGEMVTAVGSTPNSIGYMDLVYVKGDIKTVNFNGVAPTVENVINGKYPVWGYGYMMTKGEPTGASKAFIEYVQSKEFQNGSVKKLKFIPLSSMKK
jgi:phosphate transport system substrate-binding protein